MWWQQADGGVREVMNGVMYVLSTGCQCVLSRKTCLPPRRMVNHLLLLLAAQRDVGSVAPRALCPLS
jgi:hypothetical protein